MADLSGRVVVVTGGCGLVGGAIVQAVEASGGTAIATSRSENRVCRFNAEAAAERRRSRAALLQFSGEDEVRRFVDRATVDFGHIDGAVNNAAHTGAMPSLSETRWRDWAEAAIANVGYAVTLSVMLARAQEATKIKSIVNIGSIYGTLAPDFSIYPDGMDPSTILYGSTKAALLQATRYLAAQWAANGIRVNAVSPGGVANAQSLTFAEGYARRVPQRRMTNRDEVASTVVFLLSDAASAVTGVNLPVDGGLHVW
jgi:NAD(P)-dependent dehydrogenase (short-subunit alcohol dehydrogenase family)